MRTRVFLLLTGIAKMLLPCADLRDRADARSLNKRTWEKRPFESMTCVETVSLHEHKKRKVSLRARQQTVSMVRDAAAT